MSQSAGSALADRFAALAGEQEFRFAIYPRADRGVFGDEAGRFRFAYPFGGPPDDPTATGVLLGDGPRQPGEFARINRFRWLSWAAGQLVGTDPYTPAEMSWWRYLCATFPDRIQALAGDRTNLPGLAQLSAEVVRRLDGSSGLIAPGPKPKLTNWPAIQASLRVIRERFNAERWNASRPDAALVAFPDHGAFDYWHKTTVERAMPGSAESRGWQSRGQVWGFPEEVDAFVSAAVDAAKALPAELSFAPPLFPWFNAVSNGREVSQAHWLEFLYLIYPSAFTTQDDNPGPGSRVARLTTSPFSASVIAIDRILNGDAAAVLREFNENAIRTNPWFREADRNAALAALQEVEARKVRRVSSASAVHWMDYPKRVEKFADLISVLETLDRHDAEDGFTFESFRNESAESAYTVDFRHREPEFHPRLDRMPGLESLLDRFEVDGYSTLTSRQVRELRRCAAKAIGRDGAEVSAMSFAEVLAALEARDRPPPPPPVAPTPEEGLRTFGDFLANVRSTESAVAETRAIADSMNGEPGTAHFRIQAAIWDAEAAYRKHPAFPLLEAHVNRVYGAFTYDHLLRVRGEVCGLRRCGTDEVNALLVEAVIAALDGPTIPAEETPMAADTARRVDTRPASLEPPPQSVEAAMRALPSALNNAPMPRVVLAPAGRRGAGYTALRQALETQRHKRDAAEWAIHRHAEAGRLEACPGTATAPGVWFGPGEMLRRPANHVYDRERCILWATEALRVWWHEMESGTLAGGGGCEPGPGCLHDGRHS